MFPSVVCDFESPCLRYWVTVEDNGRVACAYLKRAAEIVGTVWLCNHCPTPPPSEWGDRSAIPFANCIGYMSEEGRVAKAVEATDIDVDWEFEGDSPVAYVYLFQNLYGVIGVGDHPGYARFAIEDGPLARVMEIDEAG